jgi:hypothetical protein
MNARHAAALVFVGWYLMVPPVMGTSNDSQAKDSLIAPLGYWTLIEPYESLSLCQERVLQMKLVAYRDNHETDAQVLKENTASGSVPIMTVAEARKWDIAIANAECIATDDPRLPK